MTTEAESAPGGGSAGALMRVSSAKIEKLMDLLGQLSLSVAETVNSPDLAGLDLASFESSSHRLKMLIREVQDAATELRLVTLDDVFRRLRRMIREMERETGKKINLVIEGEDTLIDKLVSDRLYDPLLHVLRNSADHGLETPDERAEVGKAPAGQITLSASQIGSEVRIVVADDGRGLSREKILKRARERGFFGPSDEPEPAALWKMIFEPGFSTAETVSTLSGRGVGMDVLNATMKDLRGRITVDSEAGQGTRVSLFIPVSLAFLDCILLRRGDMLFAAPVEDVSEIVKPASGHFVRPHADPSAEFLPMRGDHIPICRLDSFYGEAVTAEHPSEDSVVIVFEGASGPIAIPVDEVLDRQQVVMKPLIGSLADIRASWGCALLGTGEVALVLDFQSLATEPAR